MGCWLFSNYGPQGLGVPNPVTGGTMWVADRLGYKMFAPQTWDNAYEETSTTIDVGISGVLENGWEYDVSYTTNEYDSESTSRLWDDQKMNDLYFNIGGNDALGNPMCYGCSAVNRWWLLGMVDLIQQPILTMLTLEHFCGVNQHVSMMSGSLMVLTLIMKTIDLMLETVLNLSLILTQHALVSEFGMLAGGPIGFALVAEYQDTGYDLFPSSNVVDGCLFGVLVMLIVVDLEIDMLLVVS